MDHIYHQGTCPPAVNPNERLYRVVEEGLCIGCGLCQSLAGSNKIIVKRVESGYECPVVVGKIDHEIVDLIYDTCPGTRFDGMPLHILDSDTRIDLYWGPCRQTFLAHASDHDTRKKAATGGVLTALAKFLVGSERVKFVLHSRPSQQEPTFGEHQLSFNEADVSKGTGSIYGPTAPLREIKSTLDLNQPFAFIGKPCDIAALRNLALFDKRVEKLIKYWLAPVCGGYVPPTAMNKFLSTRGLTQTDLKQFCYRGEGCPGRVEFETNDGRTWDADMLEPFGGYDEHSWQLPYRCKICPDGTGEAADIVAGDQWENASPDPVKALTDPGTNAVIVRTSAGEKLMVEAQNAGYITLENQFDLRWYDTCQPHQISKKKSIRARWDGLAAEGRLVPRSQGLRLDRLAQEIDAQTYKAEKEGLRRRTQEK
jgi:coenzyme F420 hydrogenase subunit beta